MATYLIITNTFKYRSFSGISTGSRLFVDLFFSPHSFFFFFFLVLFSSSPNEYCGSPSKAHWSLCLPCMLNLSSQIQHHSPHPTSVWVLAITNMLVSRFGIINNTQAPCEFSQRAGRAPEWEKLE